MNACILAGLLLVVFGLCCDARVRLRLMGGKHDYEGRVEVFIDEKWVLIADKSWNKKAAQVVCRHLGYSGEVIRYTKKRFYGTPRRLTPVYLEKINCTGKETELDQCELSGWKPTKLSFYRLAGVMCHAGKELLILPQPSPATGNVERSELKIRLDGEEVDGFISEGVLQVSFLGNWGHVCIDNWDYKDMRVACGHLGYPDAVNESRMSIEYNGAGLFVLNNVNCLGSESSLFSCDHGGLREHQCDSEKAVWLKCKVFKRTNEFKNAVKIKLLGAALPSEGRVEIYHRDKWTNICDDNWNLVTANAVCRGLGYGTAYEANKASLFGQGTQLFIMDEVNCRGFESDVSQCKWTYRTRSRCTHFEDSGVRCNTPKYETRGQEVRLVGGQNASEGRVEVKIDGTWGTICGDNWGIKAAMVVCRELNSNFAAANITGKSFGIGEGMTMSGTLCIGDEMSLTKCLRDDDVKCSSPNNVAAVRCSDALPDLALSISELHNTLRVDQLPLTALKCSYEENCLASSATKMMPYMSVYTRRLLRFSTKILNFGSSDYRPWANKEDWIWHSCHKHYHSQEEFAVYDLLTPDMRHKVAEGHKASFCLEDTDCLNGVDPVYDCKTGEQGISRNCFDNYQYGIDCQWVDVSDIRRYDRSYILTVNINPRLFVAETDFDNNVIHCKIFDRGSLVYVRDCRYNYCTSGLRSRGGNSFDACCVFPFNYKGETYETCTKKGYHLFWCATTADFDKDRKWGLC